MWLHITNFLRVEYTLLNFIRELHVTPFLNGTLFSKLNPTNKTGKTIHRNILVQLICYIKMHADK